MNTREKFLERVEAFLELTGFTASRLGKEAIGDHTFVRKLREGSDVTTARMDTVDAYMKKNKRRKK